MPRLLHLRQCGVSLLHFRFESAQAPHAFVSEVVAMFVNGGFHNVWRMIDQLVARSSRLNQWDCIYKSSSLAGAICFGIVTAAEFEFSRKIATPEILQTYLLGTRWDILYASRISFRASHGILGNHKVRTRSGAAKVITIRS